MLSCRPLRISTGKNVKGNDDIISESTGLGTYQYNDINPEGENYDVMKTVKANSKKKICAGMLSDTCLKFGLLWHKQC